MPDQNAIVKQANEPRSIVLGGTTLPMVQNTAKLNSSVNNGKWLDGQDTKLVCIEAYIYKIMYLR